MEHDDYYGGTFAAVGAGTAPAGYAQTEKARAGIDKLRGYFKANPPPDLHHKAMLLWASRRVDGLMTAEEKAAAVKELLAAQRPDGGWSLPSLGPWKRRDGSANDAKAPSDGYATGLVIYVLRQAEVPTANEQLKSGVKWLQTQQRESGRWFTRSLNNDKAHYITNAGTSYAVLALEACGAL
jgi:squalene-hopene/tetraprenyl-beta-curcumene cyclase